MPRSSTGRTERLEVRLTSDELTFVSGRAAAKGLSLSDYVRTRILAGRSEAEVAAEVVVRRLMADDTAALVRQLSTIGVNLNQIARFMHEHDLVPSDNLEACLFQVKETLLSLRR